MRSYRDARLLGDPQLGEVLAARLGITLQGPPPRQLPAARVIRSLLIHTEVHGGALALGVVGVGEGARLALDEKLQTQVDPVQTSGRREGDGRSVVDESVADVLFGSGRCPVCLPPTDAIMPSGRRIAEECASIWLETEALCRADRVCRSMSLRGIKPVGAVGFKSRGGG